MTISGCRSMLFHIVTITLSLGMHSFIAAQERGMGGVGLTVFADRNFGGRSATFTSNVADLRSSGLDNRISSLRVGAGERWEVCEQTNYRGRCVVVFGEERDLRTNSWNDNISSVRRVSGAPSPSPQDPYIVLFTQVNFRGSPRNYSGPVGSLDGRAQSVTVGRGTWQLCQGRNFSGRCETITQSVSDLRTIGMNGRVASARPVDDVSPQQPPADPYVVVFSQSNYRGTSTNYSSAQPRINARIGSITIGRGVWEICTGSNFSGRCETLTQSQPNIRSLGFGNNVRSLRPLERQPR